MAQLSHKLTRSALRLVGAKEEKRTYAAAKVSRLTSDWLESNASANQEIKMSQRTLRARARQLARDDDYVKGWLDKLVTNVVGQKGIKLEPNAKDESGTKIKTLNDPIRAAWSKWSKKQYASISGTDTFREIVALALRTTAVDGECVIQTIFDSSNPFKFSLHMIDSDWLDEDYNDPQLSNGNRVIMSVEVDQFNKPVAYHFTAPRWNNVSIPDYPGNLGSKGIDRKRVPAEQIIHLFKKSRPGQVRGVTWMHAAMRRLNMLDGYEEAELVGQRVAASVTAYAIPPTGEGFVGSDTPDNIEQEFAAGMLQSLPPGYTLHTVDSKRPGNTYAAYVKQVLRAIAGSLNISYNSFANDLEATSYSSIRAGSIEERDMYRCDQEWLAENLCQAVYERWLEWNVDSPELKIPFSELEQVSSPVWRGRGFDWVDPSKDTKADIEANNAGLKTKTEILAERGRDYEEVMQELAHEKEIESGLGLSFGVEQQAMLDMEAATQQGEIDQESAVANQKQKAAA